MTFQVIHIRKYISTSVTFYVWRLDAYRRYVILKTFFTAKQSRFKGEKKKLADDEVNRTGWKRLSTVQFNSSWYITYFGKMLRRQWSVTKSGPLSGGGAGGASPPTKVFALLERGVGHSWKLLEIVQKFGLLSQNSSPPLVSQVVYGSGRNCSWRVQACLPQMRWSFNKLHKTENIGNNSIK